MYTKELDLAQCPHCGREAFGCDIEKEFGYRTCDNKPQSWCKRCRTDTYRNFSVKAKKVTLK